MQFLSGLFDGQSNVVVTAFFALVFVLALIVFGMWILKFVFRTTSGLARNRGRRLAIVERLPVDGRRQLMIVRRDGVEHVIMTGGGHDLVVESGIPVEDRPAADPASLSAALRRAAAPPPKPVAPEAVAAAAPVAAVVAEPTPPPAPPAPVHQPKAAEPAAAARAPVPPAAPAEPVRTPQPAHPEAVKEALTAAFQRRVPSLRHTALLRPVSVMEPAAGPMAPLPGDKSGEAAADSDRTPQTIEHGGRDELERAATFGGKGNAGAS